MILVDFDLHERCFPDEAGAPPLCFREGGDGESVRLDPAQIQPAGIDATLSRNILTSHRSSWLLQKLCWQHADIKDRPCILRPREFILASTREILDLRSLGSGDQLCAVVNGKSSLARSGIMVHVTAGFVDPGWYGAITLEILNVSPVPFPLHYGQYICQLQFHRLSRRPMRGYGEESLNSHYQFQGTRYQGDLVFRPGEPQRPNIRNGEPCPWPAYFDQLYQDPVACVQPTPLMDADA